MLFNSRLKLVCWNRDWNKLNARNYSYQFMPVSFIKINHEIPVWRENFISKIDLMNWNYRHWIVINYASANAGANLSFSLLFSSRSVIRSNSHHSKAIRADWTETSFCIQFHFRSVYFRISRLKSIHSWNQKQTTKFN